MKVTIKGYPGEGKTVVMSIIAKALRDRGFSVITPEGMDSALAQAEERGITLDPDKKMPVVELREKTRKLGE